MFKDVVEIRRFKKKKGAERPKDEESEKRIATGNPDEVVATIEVSDTGNLVGVVSGEKAYVLDDESLYSEGETWRCYKVPYGMTCRLYSIAKVSGTQKTQTAETDKAVKAEKKKHEAAVEETVPLSKYRALEEDLRQVRIRYRDANLRLGRQTKAIKGIEGLKEQIRQKDECNKSLKQQIQVLERKQSTTSVTNLEVERDMYKKQVEEMQAKIAQLNGIIEAYSAANKAEKVTTYLLGDTSIRCSLLEEDNYRVYFSPGKRTLRFIPDSEGRVPCDKKVVSIPSIAKYTGFSKIRALEAVCEDGEVRISLA